LLIAAQGLMRMLYDYVELVITIMLSALSRSLSLFIIPSNMTLLKPSMQPQCPPPSHFARECDPSVPSALSASPNPSRDFPASSLLANLAHQFCTTVTKRRLVLTRTVTIQVNDG